MTEPDLSAALALTGPDATLKLYRDWAATYDSGFAESLQYNLPAHVAHAFLAAEGKGPVLDVGCGTGLLAQRLREMGYAGDIDGLDFSAEMLDIARPKALYRSLIQADITQPIPLSRAYHGITSSGTFTAGHVGPEAFGPLLALALPNCQFSLSINLRVWEEKGFHTALPALQTEGRITGLQLIEVQVYGQAAATLDPDHAQDRALIALFRAA